MALSARQSELLVLGKFKRSQLSLLKNGVRLEQVLAQTIPDMMLVIAADRYKLAAQFLSSAKRMNRSRPPMNRSVISRSYYAMYHAARAISFLCTEGDDHESHNDLHNGLPADFPNLAQWQNALKDARLRRNEADYDPYPDPDDDFGAIGRLLLQSVEGFLAETKAYLENKGCVI